ncbi:MAG: glycosyltransferase [Muribaculaceae bacterium]|nr:glycosyltransferase [Muribaculaceae bacterium]
MRVLHYTVGLPTMRNGGSIRYAASLAQAQARLGLDVSILTAGDTLFKSGKSRIKSAIQFKGIPHFQITTPITPTLVYGSRDINKQINEPNIDDDKIKNWIKEQKIDILHVHSFQGLPLKILKLFKDCGVKIIYTTHDFTGLCLKYNFINNKGICNKKPNPNICAHCLSHAPSDFFLRLLNSKLYRLFKKAGFGKLLKKISLGKIMKENTSKPVSDNSVNLLMEKFRGYFSLVDTYHFNSLQTRDEFEKHLGALTGKVIHLTMPGLEDKYKPVRIEHNRPINMGYFGNKSVHKGFEFIKELSRQLLQDSDYNINITAFSGDTDFIIHPAFKTKPSFDPDNLSKILYSLDVLIVPSICLETFSLVVIEALAHGRPVIISSRVGAKDIVKQITPDFIYNSSDDLKRLLLTISRDSSVLEKASGLINQSNLNYSFDKHTYDILELYQ